MQAMKDCVAIVTGAAHQQGIGFATCLMLAEAGAKVVLTDLPGKDGSAPELDARAAEIIAAGGDAMAVAVDVTDRQQIAVCVSVVHEHYGRIDSLFNNAGSPIGVGPFLEMTDQQWDMSYQVNLKGTVNFCQAVLPVMIAQGGGAIVNNASVAGLGAVPQMAAYTATKFGVVGLTKALAAEFGPQGVRVNAVCPGMVWTQMGQAEVAGEQHPGESFEAAKQRLVHADLVPLERWASPEEIGKAVVFLSSDSANYISGVALPVAGGMAPGL